MPRAWVRPVIWTLFLLLLLQPVAPLALGHGGESSPNHHDDSGDEDDANGDGAGETAGPAPNVDPRAEPLTPKERYVEQRNPDVHGSLVVFEQMQIGRDWDIMAYNLSTEGPAFPLTLEENDEMQPTVRGPWAAWEEHDKGEIDIVVLNLRTGNVHRVPNLGGAERYPTILGDTVYFLLEEKPGKGQLRGYDLISKRVLDPIGNQTIISPPKAWGHQLVWAEGARIEAKLQLMDRRTGEIDALPQTWNLVEGPTVGPWGVAWVAEFGGAQMGTYTVAWNQTTGLDYKRTSIYPHANVEVCDAGVVWDQPGSSTTSLQVINLFDNYVDTPITLGDRNFNAHCSGDHLIYEKLVPAEDEDLDRTRRIYRLDLARVRVPNEATVQLDEGLERAIARHTMTFTGYAEAGDPREPIAAIYGGVDGEDFRRLEIRERGNGYEWSMTVEPRRYFSGQHALSIVVEDVRGYRTSVGFTFFTNAPYSLDDAIYEQGLQVPREQAHPFPFNLFNHYDDYRPFYNTILLLVVVLIAIAVGVRRYLNNRPPAPPEYVAPELD